MFIPMGMTEAQILQEMEKVINQIVREITPFGYYRGDDLKQQAYVFGIEAMNTEKYNPEKPLGAFLRTCIINRIISLSRDKYTRNEPPCKKCPFFDKHMAKSQSGCTAFDNKMKCSKFKSYHDRNQNKRNIMNLKSETPLYEDTMGSDYRPFIDVDNSDYINNISKYLTNESKTTPNDIILGKSVSKRKLEKLRGEVANVIKPST